MSIIGSVHVNIDRVKPGGLPAFKKQTIGGEPLYAWHFLDVVLWFRRDQLESLQLGIINALHEPPPQRGEQLSLPFNTPEEAKEPS
jgi:hypothetical protein